MNDLFGTEPLAFLVGVTAVGKTQLALELAERAGFEIVSMDSMLVYRGMNIGTAKPSATEIARVPHHCIDRVEPHERYDVQAYLTDAEAALLTIRARGKRALFTGGTGFYLKALAHGLFASPAPDMELRQELSERYDTESAAALHDELAGVDAALAQRLHPNDKKRVLRGLEVFRQTGRPMSELQAEWKRPLPAHTIVGLQRSTPELDARITIRIEAMLESGWIDEVERIEASGGFSPTAEQALGYPEIRQFLRDELPRAELTETIAQRTRRFSRKQATWFRSFPIQWMDANASIEDVCEHFAK